MAGPITYTTGLDTGTILSKHVQTSMNGDMTISVETRKGNNLVLSKFTKYFVNPDTTNCYYSVLFRRPGGTTLTVAEKEVIYINKQSKLEIN